MNLLLSDLIFVKPFAFIHHDKVPYNLLLLLLIKKKKKNVTASHVVPFVLN
jgi:hypothetical protein